MRNVQKIGKLINTVDMLRYELQEKSLYLSSKNDPERKKVAELEDNLRILGDHLEDMEIRLIDILA